MASIAVLPVLIGLSVDYAIQFQARFAEAVAAGPRHPVPPSRRPPGRAGDRNGGLATAAGFGVLVLSPIPMVRGFAMLLVLGIAIAFALAITVGLSALRCFAGGRELAPRTRRSGPRLERAAPALEARSSRPGGGRRRGRLGGARHGQRALHSRSRPRQSVGDRGAAGGRRLGWGRESR